MTPRRLRFTAATEPDELGVMTRFALTRAPVSRFSRRAADKSAESAGMKTSPTARGIGTARAGLLPNRNAPYKRRHRIGRSSCDASRPAVSAAWGSAMTPGARGSLYLVAQASFSAGSVAAYGSLYAVQLPQS